MPPRPPIEERFLTELALLRSAPDAAESRTMWLRWKAFTDIGGPASPKGDAKLIPSRPAVQAYLYELDAQPRDRPVLIARLKGEGTTTCWSDWPELTQAVVRGRLEVGSAIIVEVGDCVTWSLHPSRRTAFRSPRRGTGPT